MNLPENIKNYPTKPEEKKSKKISSRAKAVLLLSKNRA